MTIYDSGLGPQAATLQSSSSSVHVAQPGLGCPMRLVVEAV